MFPSFANQEKNCLIIRIDAGLFLDFVKIILGVGGNLDCCFGNFTPPVGKVLILGRMNCLSHAIDYSSISQ